MTTEDNAHAGQGAVVLDIGDQIGALVVHTPDALIGAEIEARSLDSPCAAHAAVLERPTPRGIRYSAIIAALPAGNYALHRLPDGAEAVRVTVRGGAVIEIGWPIGAELG